MAADAGLKVSSSVAAHPIMQHKAEPDGGPHINRAGVTSVQRVQLVDATHVEVVPTCVPKPAML